MSQKVGEFVSLKGDRYRVTFSGANVTESILLLSDEPVIIEQETDGLFTNIKSKSATISVMDEYVLSDLYSNSPSDVTVLVENLTKGVTIFRGFVTPNIYTQDFNDPMNVIEIECTDNISKLQYIDYKPIHSGKPSTFNEILCKLIGACGYDSFYITPSIAPNSPVFLNDLLIDEDNFIDDDAERKPWKCIDVLEEILKYLNWSLTVYNEEVYLLDYQYLSHGTGSLYKIGIGGSVISTSVSPSNIDLNEEHKRENIHLSSDTVLSMDETFNQIAINCNTYPYENFYEDMFKNITHQNHQIIEDNWNNVHDFHYYTTNKWKQWYFNEEDLSMAYPLVYGNETLFHMFGCLATKRMVYEKGKTPSQPNFEDVLIMRNQQDKKVTVPYIGVEGDQAQLYGSTNNETAYLCITGSFMMAAEKRLILNDPGAGWTKIQYNPGIGKYGYNAFRAEIKIGDKYWNSYTNTWSTTPYVTYIPVGNEGQSIFDNWLQFTNNVTYDMNLGKNDCYAIPIKPSDHLYGTLSITIYPPVCPEWHKEHFGSVWYSKYSGLKNFNVEFVKPNDGNSGLTDDEGEKDIIYRNIINDEFSNEFSDMEFKINSQTELENSQSSVLYKYINTTNGREEYGFADYITNAVTSNSQVQEQNVIQSWVEHYSSPKYIIEMTIRNNILTPINTVTYSLPTVLRNRFLVDSISLDLANDSARVKLIEF